MPLRQPGSQATGTRGPWPGKSWGEQLGASLIDGAVWQARSGLVILLACLGQTCGHALASRGWWWMVVGSLVWA